MRGAETVLESMRVDHRAVIWCFQGLIGTNSESLIAMTSTGSRSKKGAARSHCAMLSHGYELRRIQAMTMEERVIAALTMKQRFAWIHPARIR